MAKRRVAAQRIRDEDAEPRPGRDPVVTVRAPDGRYPAIVTGRREVEIYGAFMKVSGALEIYGAERLSDTVNRFGSFIHLRNASTEPLASHYPVLGRLEDRATITKAAVILICPRDQEAEGTSAMWRERVAHPASINTAAFSMVGDVHLEPSHSLEDHLERNPGDFLPITNMSALWVASPDGETHALQRPFALLNPTAILSFSLREG